MSYSWAMDPMRRTATRRGLLAGSAVSLGALIAGCSTSPTVVVPDARAMPGVLVSGTFKSRYRHQTVGWTISYPPGHPPGSAINVALILHGYQSNHAAAFSSLGLQHSQAQVVDRRPLPPIALAAVDGGNGYWHPPLMAMTLRACSCMSSFPSWRPRASSSIRSGSLAGRWVAMEHSS